MKIHISSRLGVLSLISCSYSDDVLETECSSPFSLNIWGLNLKDKSPGVVEKMTEKITLDLEEFLSTEKQIVNKLIDEDFLFKNDWLDRAYQYRFKKPFPFQDFKDSFKLQALTLKYEYKEFGKIRAYKPVFLPAQIFSFGFQVSSDEEMNGQNFIYFDTDYNYEACLNVLRQENEPKLSYDILRSLSFMEGCIHQGTLYNQSSYITEELIKSINTAHQEVKFEILRLLYNLQQGSVDTLERDIQTITYKRQKEQAEEETKYGQEVKAVFENSYDEIAKWKKEEPLKEITEAILEKIST